MQKVLELPKIRLNAKEFRTLRSATKGFAFGNRNFLKKLSKTFIFFQRAQSETSDLRESESLGFALNRQREQFAGSTRLQTGKKVRIPKLSNKPSLTIFIPPYDGRKWHPVKSVGLDHRVQCHVLEYQLVTLF